MRPRTSPQGEGNREAVVGGRQVARGSAQPLLRLFLWSPPPSRFASHLPLWGSIEIMHDHASGTVERARRLRREMSLPEVLLWRILRVKPMGVKFRNQHPLGDFVVDFYSHSARTAFEIDGISHNMGDQPEFDVRRDAKLNGLGVQVIRIPAADVLRDPDSVADSMVRHCLNISSPSGATH
jgi:very-short-patch-repair endonuclease